MYDIACLLLVEQQLQTIIHNIVIWRQDWKRLSVSILHLVCSHLLSYTSIFTIFTVFGHAGAQGVLPFSQECQYNRLLFALLELLARQLLANLRSCNMIVKALMQMQGHAKLWFWQCCKILKCWQLFVRHCHRSWLRPCIWKSGPAKQQDTADHPIPSKNGFVCTKALPFQDSPKSSQKLWEVPQTEKQTSWPQCYCRLAWKRLFLHAQALIEISSNLL